MPRSAMNRKFNDSDATTARNLRSDRMPCAKLVETKNSSYNDALYQHDPTKCQYSAVGQMKKGIPSKSVRPSGFPSVGKKTGTKAVLSGQAVGEDMLDEELFFDDPDYPKEISDIYLSTPVGIPYLGENHKYFNWPTEKMRKNGKVMDQLQWNNYTFEWSVTNGFLLIISKLPKDSKIGFDHDKTVDLIEYLKGSFETKFNRQVMLGFLRIDLQVDDHRKRALKGHQALDFLQGMYRGQEYDVVREDHPVVAGRVKCRRREIICWNHKAISNLPVVLSALEHSRDKIQSLDAVQHLAWSAEEILKRQYRYVGEALHRNEVTATKSLQAAQFSQSLLSDVLLEVGQLGQQVATLESTSVEDLKDEISQILDEKLQPFGQQSDRLSNQVATLAGDIAKVSDHAAGWDEAAQILVQQGAAAENQRNIQIGQNDMIIGNQETLIRQNNIISSQLADIESILANLIDEYQDWRKIDTTTKLGIIKSLYDLKGSYEEVRSYLEDKFQKYDQDFKVTRWALNKLVLDHHDCSCHSDDATRTTRTESSNFSNTGQVQIQSTDSESEYISDSNFGQMVATLVNTSDQSLKTEINQKLDYMGIYQVSQKIIDIVDFITENQGSTKNQIVKSIRGGRNHLLQLVDVLEISTVIADMSDPEIQVSRYYLSDRFQLQLQKSSREKKDVPQGTHQKKE